MTNRPKPRQVLHNIWKPERGLDSQERTLKSRKKLRMKFEEMPPSSSPNRSPSKRCPSTRKITQPTTAEQEAEGKAGRRLVSAKAAAVCAPVALVRNPHDRLPDDKVLHLVRGAGERSPPDRRCRQEQCYAGRGVQAARQQHVRQAHRSARGADITGVHKRWEGVGRALRSAYFSDLEEVWKPMSCKVVRRASQSLARSRSASRCISWPSSGYLNSITTSRISTSIAGTSSSFRWT